MWRTPLSKLSSRKPDWTEFHNYSSKPAYCIGPAGRKAARGGSVCAMRGSAQSLAMNWSLPAWSCPTARLQHLEDAAAAAGQSGMCHQLLPFVNHTGSWPLLLAPATCTARTYTFIAALHMLLAPSCLGLARENLSLHCCFSAGCQCQLASQRMWWAKQTQQPPTPTPMRLGLATTRLCAPLQMSFWAALWAPLLPPRLALQLLEVSHTGVAVRLSLSDTPLLSNVPWIAASNLAAVASESLNLL